MENLGKALWMICKHKYFIRDCYRAANDCKSTNPFYIAPIYDLIKAPADPASDQDWELMKNFNLPIPEIAGEFIDGTQETFQAMGCLDSEL